MKYLFIFFFSFFTSIVFGQTIISQFNWNSPPFTAAAIGPNATSPSSSALVDINGVGGTNGLNAGLPKADINMTIPGSALFDVNGIDISFDYQRDESAGTFWSRGSSLIIDGTNQLSVSYRVQNGSGGFNTVNSGNAFNIPNDDVFRNYRFIYLPTTGQGFLLVNNTVVWTNDGPDNRNLYWIGAGNVQIAWNMDGTGFNKTFMDNLIVASVTGTALPVELINFEAQRINRDVELIWSTSSEHNNDYFEIFTSKNGFDWTALASVKAAGNSESTQTYTLLDENADYGLVYYELRQTDFDGNTERLKIVAVDQIKMAVPVLFPNPCRESVTITADGVINDNSIQILGLEGKNYRNAVVVNAVSNNIVLLDLSQLPQGTYIVRMDNFAPQKLVRL